MTDLHHTLIPIAESTIDHATIQTVNARDLHEFLCVKRDFSTWIKDRIGKYDYVENRDFTQVIDSTAPQNGGAPKSISYGQEKIDYHITLDMAKELAMVERNEKGKEARQYFIAVEKAYRDQKPQDLTREQILVMALESERERLRLEKELEETRPMVQFHEEVAVADNEYEIQEACKILFNSSVKRTQLVAWLKTQGWMDKRPGRNEPTTWAIRQGYMRLRMGIKVPGGKKVNVPVLTGSGLTLLRHLYRENELFIATIPANRRLPPPLYPV